MLIFRDIRTNDEILTDSYKMKLVNDFYWEVETKYGSEKGMEISESMFGGNASAEDAPEDVAEAEVKWGYDVVLKNDLVEFSFGKWKEFQVHLKKTLDKCKDKIKENAGADYYTGDFKTKLEKFMTEFLKPNFKELQFFFGPSAMDEEWFACPIFLLECQDPDSKVQKAKMYYLKDFMVEEKA